MAIRAYILLVILCIQFGISLQQRKQIGKFQTFRIRMDYMDVMLHSAKNEISELWEAVELIQNKSMEDMPIETADITYFESRMKEQDMKINVISKGISEGKTYTLEQAETLNEVEEELNHVKNVNTQLKEEINEIKQINGQLKEYQKEFEQRNSKLIIELLQTKEANNKLNKHVEQIKEDFLDLRHMLAAMQQTTPEPSTKTTIGTIQITTEPETTPRTTTALEPSTTLTVHVSQLTCPNGWRKFKSTCYLHVKTGANWDVANRKCAERGATLAEPKTREEFQFISQGMKRYWHYWLGGTDWLKEGTWVWSGSGRPVVSSLWAPGEPNSYNGLNEDCIILGLDGFLDVPSTYGYWYECEKPATV